MHKYMEQDDTQHTDSPCDAKIGPQLVNVSVLPRPPALHQKRRGLGGSPRGGWTGGWRRLPKPLGGGYCRLKLAF